MPFPLPAGLSPLTAIVRCIYSGEPVMNLSAPTFPIFLISVLLAVLAALVAYAGVKIPLVSGHAFATLGIGYILLLAGNLFRGL